MALLLNYAQQQLIKPLGGLNSANTVAQAKYDQLAAEVESLEIDKLLGSRFYQVVSASPSSYDDLLNGSSFECSGEDISHKGLRYVIAYLNHEKYTGESFINDTWNGMSQASRPDSERVSGGTIKNLQANSREIAFNAWSLTVEYIKQESQFDGLWTSNSNKRTKKPVYYGIKKTRG